MPFENGNKHGKGGARAGSGRKSEEKKRVKQEAERIAAEYIRKHIDPVLKAYSQLAAGRFVNHYNQQTGQLIYKEWEVDAPTLRHWIDKLVPSPRLAPTDKDGKTVAPLVYITPDLEGPEDE
jgi:hypothetical protein